MTTWLLLIHQLPEKPDYLRVKIRRRLHRLGALALKPSVYCLPARDDAREDLDWLALEIEQAGGEVMIWRAESLHGLTDGDIEARFRAERDQDYAKIAAAAEALAGEYAGLRADPERYRALGVEAARLRRRLDEVVRIDFFGGERRADAEAGVGRLGGVRAPGEAGDGARPPSPGADTVGRPLPVGAPRGATWVTREGVFVDRIASAWLIRRRIDPAATFGFVPGGRSAARPGELRFDMVGGEFTHVGDRCTFEVLLDRFDLGEPALIAIGEIVHDIDLKDDRFQRPEVPGVLAVLEGIAQPGVADPTRLELGAAVFDGLYARFRNEQP